MVQTILRMPDGGPLVAVLVPAAGAAIVLAVVVVHQSVALPLAELLSVLAGLLVVCASRRRVAGAAPPGGRRGGGGGGPLQRRQVDDVALAVGHEVGRRGAVAVLHHDAQLAVV